jgi:hypothetical protein
VVSLDGVRSMQTEWPPNSPLTKSTGSDSMG